MPTEKLSDDARKFLRSLVYFGGFASRGQVGCVTSRDAEKARQACRRNGWAEYVGRIHGAPKDGWRITDAGRSALSLNLQINEP